MGEGEGRWEAARPQGGRCDKHLRKSSVSEQEDESDWAVMRSYTCLRF